MSGTIRQIIGSFEDIGKDIVRETAKVPADIAGKALESLGASGTKKQSGTKTQNPVQNGTDGQNGPLGELEQTKDIQVKKTIARRALQELTQPPAKPKEPTLEEQRRMEEQKKKEMAKEEARQQSQAQIPQMSSKRRRGDLYGVKGKSSTELSKNVRQD